MKISTNVWKIRYEFEKAKYEAARIAKITTIKVNSRLFTHCKILYSKKPKIKDVYIRTLLIYKCERWW
jgi:hypothetical protein